MAELVVTLSTIPPRFGQIGPTLDSLLAQERRPDRIEVNIPRTYRRFPDWDGTLPSVPDGVHIVRVAEDLGPATKVLPTAQRYRGRDADLLLCDDDRAYSPRWAGTFLAARARHPRAAITRRGMTVAMVTGTAARTLPAPRAVRRWRITDLEFQLRFALARLRRGRAAPEPMRRVWKRAGLIEIFEGCDGVLVRPDFFEPGDARIPDLAWSVDDIWLSGMLARRGIPIWLLANTYSSANTAARSSAPLADSQVGGVGRDAANRATVRFLQDTYGIW